MLQEVVDYLSKFLDSVLAIHLLKHVVVASLNRNVYKWKNSWMIKKMGDWAQLIKHIWGIGHSYLYKLYFTLIIILWWLVSYSQSDMSSYEILVLMSRP